MGPQLFVNASFDFVGKRNLYLAISAAGMAVCLGSIFTRGLNLGVEFTGGAQIEVNFDETKTPKTPVDIASVRAALDEAGIHGAQVVTVGSEEEHAFLVRVQALGAAAADLGPKIEGVLKRAFGDEKVAYFDFDEESLDRATLRLEDASVTAEEVKQALASATELGGLGVEDVAFEKTSGTFVVHLENAANDALTALTAKFGDTYEASIDSIGAAVSKGLQRNAFLAIAGACLFIAVYVWLRFDWDFAPGVILALVHDAVFVVGTWSVCAMVLGLQGFEFNLTIVAAVLAVIGYSVNDTVVIYDRIRENKEKYQGLTIFQVVNKSINETLSRTILTSGATLLSVLAIGILGSESIRWFGWAMVVGIVSGTWSSIAVAMPITVIVYELRERQRLAAEAHSGVRAKG